mgnify:CR=1 FL=1
MPKRRPTTRSSAPAASSRRSNRAAGKVRSAGRPRTRATAGSQKERALRLADALAEQYPDAHCELTYTSPLQLLIATILSAQATDVSVNKATPALFARFPDAASFANATPTDIEPFIRSIGLYRNKAKAIVQTCRMLVERVGGEVPRTMEELLTLRGVARKTANVVLGNAFGINDGFVVDTHIQRLAVRFGLAPAGSTPQAVERRLMSLLPRERWCQLSHQIIWHGRRACQARRAGCADHPICREFGQRCELRVSAARRRTQQQANMPDRS